MTRHCPRCETALAPRQVAYGAQEVGVDHCAGCGGLYLDRGELAHLAPAGASVEAFADWLPRVSELLTAEDIHCPACTGYMRLTAVQDFDLRLDLCGRCKSVWLDRDELVRLQRAPGKLRLRASTGVAAPGDEPRQFDARAVARALAKLGELMAHPFRP